MNHVSKLSLHLNLLRNWQYTSYNCFQLNFIDRVNDSIMVYRNYEAAENYK